MSNIIKCPECDVDVPDACQDDPTYSESLCEDCDAKQAREIYPDFFKERIYKDIVDDSTEGKLQQIEDAYDRAAYDMEYRYRSLYH
jgi:hypothetical protein